MEGNSERDKRWHQTLGLRVILLTHRVTFTHGLRSSTWGRIGVWWYGDPAIGHLCWEAL